MNDEQPVHPFTSKVLNWFQERLGPGKHEGNNKLSQSERIMACKARNN